jgi:hypothetical protein
VDLDFAHGFLPRIGEENYKAVDRCVGPADLFTPDPLELPWAIVDGAWAEKRPELLETLRRHGTSLLVDTYGWRYRSDATLQVAKLRDASWAPPSSLTTADHSGIRILVEASLTAQAGLEANAYLVPGFMPDHRDEDLRPAYEQILKTASEFAIERARPLVLFVGGHTRGLERMAALIDEVPHFVEALYLQLSPIQPMTDSPSKLEQVTAIYRHAVSRGFKVIAGHAGAATPALRAFGIDAADAGLATGETFDQTRARRARRSASEDSDKRKGGRRARMYCEQIGRSLDAEEIDRVLNVPNAAAELRGCRLPCHRFSSDHILERAREHSLWARVADAQMVSSLPTSMRATAVYERLRNQRSALTAINGALEAAGEATLTLSPVDNHIAWVSRVVASRSAA